jgi:hypothetical protein
MKIFDTRFIVGTILTAAGTFGVIAGFLSFLPPASNIALGILLTAACLPMAIFGHRFAKNAHPNPAKTSIETLRKAGLLDKK